MEAKHEGGGRSEQEAECRSQRRVREARVPDETETKTQVRVVNQSSKPRVVRRASRLVKYSGSHYGVGVPKGFTEA